MIKLSNEDGTAPPPLPTHYDYDYASQTLVVTFGETQRVRYVNVPPTLHFLVKGNPRQNYDFLNWLKTDRNYRVEPA